MLKRLGLLVVAAALAAMPTTGWALTAEVVTAKTGIAGGLCSFPRIAAGDDKLAMELARRPSFVVHLLSADAAAVGRVRDAAESAGLLGRSLYAEPGAAKSLPFANRLVDLLIVTDLADGDLTPELKAEWTRVLAPRRGTALVGRSKEAGAGLSADKLKEWVKDLPGAKVVCDETGVWAIVRTDLPAGTDAWTHRCHGPENSQVSGDTTLKPPFLTQWWGLPRQEGFWGTTVVSANGRMFSLRGSRNAWDQVFLTARSLNSGVQLWQKLLRPAAEKERVPHGGYVAGRSCLVVAGDVLFLIEKDGVVRLNAETGEQIDRLAGPKPGGQVKWFAVAGGTLAVLSGEPDKMAVLSYQTIAANPVGRELAVYDIETKKELWHDTVAGDIDERAIAIRDNRIYYIAQGVATVCRELKTGKEVWSTTDTDILSQFATPTPKVVGGLLASQPALMVLDDVILLRARWAKDLFALSRDKGELLWKKPSSGGRSVTAVAAEGMWIGFRDGPFDLKTGLPVEKTRAVKFISSGCGPTTAMPGYLISCFGKVEDARTNTIIRNEDIKSPCDVGSLVSEGLMITVPSECGCYYEVKGYRTLASAGGIQPHAAAFDTWKTRLTSANAAEPKALDATDADWTTYRHDPARSGATAATIGVKEGAQPKVLWQWKPAGAADYKSVWPATGGPRLAPDYIATAPVAAGGFVWFAAHDGTIHCVKADTGAEVWKFATAACMFAPPTIYKGRLLAGGGDGRIYCLDATTGKSLWQLQAGPVDRRVFWYGHLISTWPITGGVVVKDDVAYAVAGYQKENGLHAYAIDPIKGEVLWEKDDAGAGTAGNPATGLGSLGSVAVAGGKLWLASSPSGFFDLKTGDWKAASNGNFGGEVGALGHWLILGGRRISETQDTVGRPLQGTGMVASHTNLTPGAAPLTAAGISLPAWDSQLVVMPPTNMGGAMTAVPADKMEAWMAARAAQPARLPPGSPKPAEWVDSKSWATEAVAAPIAFALAKDQVVVACSDVKGHKLIGFSRADGAKVWTVALPEQPAMNRLAIDRDGRVIVSLCDGSVVCVGKE